MALRLKQEMRMMAMTADPGRTDHCARGCPGAPATAGQTNFHFGAGGGRTGGIAPICGAGIACATGGGAAGSGEIDLVLENGEEIVFVEVKASRTHARAAASIGRRQIDRLLQSAEAYIGRLPTGLSTPMRFDVALVDGRGHVDVIENALGSLIAHCAPAWARAIFGAGPGAGDRS
jgi:putative endonuclease